MKNAYLFLSLAGLIFDLIGFIGIFLTKLKDVKTIDDNMYNISLYRYGKRDLDTITKQLIYSINDKLNTMNKSYKIRDRKSLKFFLLVCFGVGLQVLSVFVLLCQN